MVREERQLKLLRQLFQQLKLLEDIPSCFVQMILRSLGLVDLLLTFGIQCLAQSIAYASPPNYFKVGLSLRTTGFGVMVFM